MFIPEILYCNIVRHKCVTLEWYKRLSYLSKYIGKMVYFKSLNKSITVYNIFSFYKLTVMHKFSLKNLRFRKIIKGKKTFYMQCLRRDEYSVRFAKYWYIILEFIPVTSPERNISSIIKHSRKACDEKIILEMLHTINI